MVASLELDPEIEQLRSVIPNFDVMTEEQLKEAFFFLDFLNTLIVIEAKKGQGKTLLAVALATKFKDLFNKKVLLDFQPFEAFGDFMYLDEKKFMSELNKVTDIVRDTDEDEVGLGVKWSLKKMGLDIEGSVMVLDEAYRYFDCRTPSDKLVRVFGYFVAQMRHYHITLILLCPSKRYLDRRVRDQIDYLGKVAFNKRSLQAHARFLSYITGDIKPLRVYGPNYFNMYDSWSPIAIRKKVLDLRGQL